MSSAGKSSGPRALRAAVVVDDKLYDEVHQSSPEPVTIGSAIAKAAAVREERRVLVDILD